MMNGKKKPAVPQQEKIEELSDEQLSQVNGGLTIQTIPGNGSFTALKFGQALEKNSAFTKADDRLP